MRNKQYSQEEARRIALAAQGFDTPRPARPARTHIRRVIRQLGLLQLDFVKVVVPSHYMVLFSRLGAYPPSWLDDLAYKRREFLEQWAHEASILPLDAWPLLRHRMDEYRVRPSLFGQVVRKHPEYVQRVLDEIRERGPLSAAHMPDPDGHSRRLPGSWYGTVPRAVLEAHFAHGTLAVTRRTEGMSREFDLAERVIPPEHHGRILTREEAQCELLRRSARSHGIGTIADFADYYRMPVREARPLLRKLLEEGTVHEAHVDGWGEPAYVHRDAPVPERIAAASLLSPFDPVIWFRPRTRRLFHFDYRMEVFIPPGQRRWGVYMLPFLMNERLVARVDAKTDRPAGVLRVPAAYLETHADPDVTATALAAELRALAAWLGLRAVRVGRKGDFARALSAAVRNT